MAGTQTTTLIKGDPVVREANASAAVDVGQVVEHHEGTYGSLIPAGTKYVAKGKQPFMIAAESGSVEVGGSYKTGERVKYYIGKKGDQFYAQCGASDGTKVTSDSLGLSGKTDGRLAQGGSAVGTVAWYVDDATLNVNATGPSIVEVL